MPSPNGFPGVFVAEFEAGARAIVGVPTSITAFVGSACRGPLNTPVAISSFREFERTFGGLSATSAMSFSARDYFANGGNSALIVRVADASVRTASLALATSGSRCLHLLAASPGAWGCELRASVTPSTSQPSSKTRFNLSIQDGSGREEHFRDISVRRNDLRFVGRVLEDFSSLAKFFVSAGSAAAPRGRPSFTEEAPFSGGDDGRAISDQDIIGSEEEKTGLYSLELVEGFNLLVIPPPVRGGATASATYLEAARYVRRRRAFLIVDPDPDWILEGVSGSASCRTATSGIQAMGLDGPEASNAAVYFPNIVQANPLLGGSIESSAPSGAIAGIYARTDLNRGVWKAPAGLDASFHGVTQFALNINDQDNSRLNRDGINALRSFPGVGPVIWGARTMRGADRFGDEYKYVPVRRTALFIEESVDRGTKWTVFEPNGPTLWAEVRTRIEDFLYALFRQGAFQGATPSDAYFVKVGADTTTSMDISRGKFNVQIGFAAIKPAEFIGLTVQLSAQAP